MRILSVTNMLLGNIANACCSPSLNKLLWATMRTPNTSLSSGTTNDQETLDEPSFSNVTCCVLSSTSRVVISSSVTGLKKTILTEASNVSSDKLDILVEIDVVSPSRKKRGILGVTINFFCDTVNASLVALFIFLSCANRRKCHLVLLSGTVNAITVSPFSLVRNCG